ncbi:acyl-CoA dehydrogenase family protein [Nocardia salmonicida]|uniref:acyl-CoA dehydrogenase family protein n=2 Tax=Nocardia salmonicida TaxID=53431 RepID=UPI00362BF5AB
MTTTIAPATLAEALPRIRSILTEFVPGTGERDLAFEHPDALIQALADAGFGRLRVPVEYGGFDVDLPTLFGLLAEAGQADSNIPQIWRGHFTTTEILRAETDPVVREHWFRAIGAGAVFGNAQSEPSALVAEAVGESAGWGVTTTRARVGEDGVRVVSGTKFYSTGARFADYIRAAVVDDEGTRGFVVIPARHPGVTHADDWDGIGQRQTGSGTTYFENVPVEEHGDIGRYKESLRGLDSFVQIVHLANLTGIARSIVAETAQIVRGRTRTSLHALTQHATEDPDILSVIGLLETRRLTAETLLRHAAEQLEAAHAAGDEAAYTRAYLDTSAAQIAVIEAVLDAATRAFDAGGSSTIRNSVHLDRHWRNARTLASHNPVIYKPRVLGDFVVNGNAPVPGYYRQRPSVVTPDATVAATNGEATATADAAPSGAR